MNTNSRVRRVLMKPSSFNTWKILCWIKRGEKQTLKAPTNQKSWKALIIRNVFSVPNPEQSVTNKSWCWFPFQAPCTTPRMHCPSCGHLGDPFYESPCSIIYLITVRALQLIFPNQELDSKFSWPLAWLVACTSLLPRGEARVWLESGSCAGNVGSSLQSGWQK